MGGAQSDVGEDKKGTGGAKGREIGSIDEIYTPVFRARAGSTRYIFFLLFNRV
jgi:hypothetical protein